MLLAAAVVLLSCHVGASSNSTWSQAAPMAEARALLGLSFVPDTQQVAPGLGGLLAVGGVGASGASLASTEVYYPYTGGWRPQATLANPLAALATAASYQTLYALGGLDDNVSPLANASAYVPVSNGEWEAIAEMPDSRAFAAALALDGIVYVVGGENASGVAGKVLIYDPSVEQWSSGASMPTPRKELALAAAGGLLYAIGGTGADGMASSVCEAYEPSSDTWHGCPSLPYAASALGAAAVNDVIFVAGGYNGQALDTVASLAMATLEWEAASPLPQATYACGVASNNKQLFVAGGFDANGTPTAALQTLTFN